MSWTVGRKVPINVYDGEHRPVCQCHNKRDAARIVAAMNAIVKIRGLRPETVAFDSVRAADMCIRMAREALK